LDTSEEQIRRENARLKWLYPGTAFSAGTWMTYFSTYLSMLYTDVYMLPVALAGALDLVSEFTRWLVGPIWGTIIDRVTLKSGKYWPWIAIAATASAAIHIVTFGLPAWSSNPAGLAEAVFAPDS
jgi:GPH family glycoside/pentoside/hexuronide:cation symporter